MPNPGPQSFYFFDFDDNVMFLKTPVFIRNTVTGEELPVTTGEFADLQVELGRPGRWENFALFDGTFRDFRDVPAKSLKKTQPQPFLRDVEEAITSDREWKAPSWDLFVYACKHQRPVSIVTARGHAPQTLKAGVRRLVEHGLLPREPNYHTVYAVANPATRKRLGDAKLEWTTPRLKRMAIQVSVDEALKKHGRTEPHRFGMSDDDPSNVSLITSAMRDCKVKHGHLRFFVINTHHEQKVKLEVFPVDFPVVGDPHARADEPLK